jgi:hypothetical protein
MFAYPAATTLSAALVGVLISISSSEAGNFSATCINLKLDGSVLRASCEHKIHFPFTTYNDSANIDLDYFVSVGFLGVPVWHRNTTHTTGPNFPWRNCIVRKIERLERNPNGSPDIRRFSDEFVECNNPLTPNNNIAGNLDLDKCISNDDGNLVFDTSDSSCR